MDSLPQADGIQLHIAVGIAQAGHQVCQIRLGEVFFRQAQRIQQGVQLVAYSRFQGLQFLASGQGNVRLLGLAAGGQKQEKPAQAQRQKLP